MGEQGVFEVAESIGDGLGRFDRSTSQDRMPQWCGPSGFSSYTPDLCRKIQKNRGTQANEGYLSLLSRLMMFM